MGEGHTKHTWNPNDPLVLIGKDPCFGGWKNPPKIEDKQTGSWYFYPREKLRSWKHENGCVFFAVSTRNLLFQPGNERKVKHVKLQGCLRKFHK